jgi:hypothetical protein
MSIKCTTDKGKTFKSKAATDRAQHSAKVVKQTPPKKGR